MDKPYDVLEICEFIARSCYAAGEDVDNLRLQKILYFIQLYFYKQYGKPCFTNKIEAWDLGPVVPDAYNHYKNVVTSKFFRQVHITADCQAKKMPNQFASCWPHYLSIPLPG